MNDYHSDVSPVSNSDSDAFGYFLGVINWSPVDKSAQQVSNKISNDSIIRDQVANEYFGSIFCSNLYDISPPPPPHPFTVKFECEDLSLKANDTLFQIPKFVF